MDNAPEMTGKALTRAVNDLLRSYLNRSDLVEVLIRCPRHPSAHLLRPFAYSERGPTRSEFEDACHTFMAAFGLPDALVNTTVHGFEVDAFFPAHGLIVELDGWEFHSSRTSFENDRDRDATMLAHGLVTVRITWERLVGTPEREAHRFRAILGHRSSYRPLIEL
jgi:hypothetical protein